MSGVVGCGEGWGAHDCHSVILSCGHTGGALRQHARGMLAVAHATARALHTQKKRFFRGSALPQGLPGEMRGAQLHAPSYTHLHTHLHTLCTAMLHHAAHHSARGNPHGCSGNRQYQ